MMKSIIQRAQRKIHQDLHQARAAADLGLERFHRIFDRRFAIEVGIHPKPYVIAFAEIESCHHEVGPARFHPDRAGGFCRVGDGLGRSGIPRQRPG